MNFCGITLSGPEAAALGGVGLTIASELIGASPLKENSIVQVGLSLVRRFLPSTSHTPLSSETIRFKSSTPTPPPTPKAPTKNQESPSPAPKRRGRPPGSTSARSSRARASK